jgi:hypothetical protein
MALSAGGGAEAQAVPAAPEGGTVSQNQGSPPANESWALYSVECPTATVKEIEVPAYADEVMIEIRGNCFCVESSEELKGLLLEYAKDVAAEGYPIELIGEGRYDFMISLTKSGEPEPFTWFCYTEEQWVSYVEQYTGRNRPNP